MPLSRREVLTALGLGVVTGGLHGEFERALDGIELDGDVLHSLDNAYGAFKEAARAMPPAQLIDPMIGNVAILDGLRRRATGGDQHRYGTLQARYAETLSWLSAEAGDLLGRGVVDRPGIAVGAGRPLAGDDSVGVHFCSPPDDV